MKRSDKVTDYVLIKAYTNSDWDSCDFAILLVDDDWRDVMGDRLRAATDFKGDYSFEYVVYTDAAEGYYVNKPDDEPVSAIIGENMQWVFVSVSEKELEELRTVEGILKRSELKISADGIAWFTAYAKDTGEQYSTADFNVREMIRKLPF